MANNRTNRVGQAMNDPYGPLGSRGQQGPTAENPYGILNREYRPLTYGEINDIRQRQEANIVADQQLNDHAQRLMETMARDAMVHTGIDRHGSTMVTFEEILQRYVHPDALNIIMKTARDTGSTLEEALNFICYQFEDYKGSKLPELTKLNKELKHIKEDSDEHNGFVEKSKQRAKEARRRQVQQES